MLETRNVLAWVIGPTSLDEWVTAGSVGNLFGRITGPSSGAWTIELLSFTGLINNVALLVAVGVTYTHLAKTLRSRHWSGKLVSGLFLGVIGIGVMMNPWQLAPGVVFDSRSILLSVGGLFLGLIPTVIAVVITCLYRLQIGGVGALTGLGVIITSAALGLIWSRLRQRPAKDFPWWEFYLFGITVHISLLLWMLSLPDPIDINVLRNLSLPIMLIFPAGTILFAKLLAGQEQQLDDKKTLREDEERFKALADTSPLAIYLFTGREQTAQYINPTFVRLFGYEMAEIQSAAQWWPLAYPDETYRRQVEEEWQRRAEHAIVTSSEIEPMETVVTCKDGSRKNIVWGFKTIGDENWAFGLDQTEQHESEVALKDSVSIFRAIAEQSVTGSYLFQELHFLYVSPRFAEIFGYSVDEILADIKPTDLLAMETVSEAEELFQAKRSGSFEHILFSGRGRRKDGTAPWIDVFATQIEVKGVPTVAGIVIDITERKRAQKEGAEQLDELRRWYDVLLGRENRVIEMKQEVNELLRQRGEPPRYPSAEEKGLDQ